MRLYEQIKSKLDEESNEETVKLSVPLTRSAAAVFRSLHAQLGGADVISQNALAVRILSHALLTEGQPSRRRKMSASSAEEVS